MGQLDYGFNQQAGVYNKGIFYPRLKAVLPAFHILICGKNPQPELQEELKTAAGQHISYLGFVH